MTTAMTPSRFILGADVRVERFDWGTIGWRVTPEQGGRQLVVLDVTIDPGKGHDFHRHPGQEETVIVKRGEILQFVEREQTILRAGDSVLVPADTVHASFNRGAEPVELQVILAPSLGGTTGYGLIDVSAEEPWVGLKPA